ncbi:LysR substrate-binding domain-containing protein [Paracoccus onubensis]|uniref:LysR family transcriptional regulator n=1 Tax=Paracoccus onubensis TaxID=1675788 RepID=A0A418T4F7_9RHOB|nr:LysR substrate-binding domain-containing protein [Paracoccus onubensis]RJE88108.1 LysR family transcriptional regulator [Paracoccus onubensis]
MSSFPTLTSLKAFAMVGNCLSFTQAAKRLGVTQSAVSRQIRQLEEAMDIVLFRRVGNSVVLTESGALLHEKLADAFDLMDEAVRGANESLPREKLTVLAPPTFAARWLARRLASVRHSLPDLDLAIHMQPENNVRFDCTIRFGTEAHQKQSSTLLMMEQHIAVCAPDLWADEQRLRRSCLLYILNDTRRLPTWENWFSATQHNRNIFPENSVEFATLDMVIQAAQSGGGIAVVDRSMIEFELKSGHLTQIDPVIVTGPFGYWLDINNERMERRRVLRFARWLQNAAGAGREAIGGLPPAKRALDDRRERLPDADGTAFNPNAAQDGVVD